MTDQVTTSERGRLEERVQALERELAALRVIVEELRVRSTSQVPPLSQPSPSTHDVAVLEALAAAIGALPFTAKEVIRHAEVDARLLEALVTARASGARSLGKLLQRMEGTDVGPACLVRLKKEHGGLVWQLAPR